MIRDRPAKSIVEERLGKRKKEKKKKGSEGHQKKTVQGQLSLGELKVVDKVIVVPGDGDKEAGTCTSLMPAICRDCIH